MSNGKANIYVPIIVAIIALIGSIIVALISKQPHPSKDSDRKDSVTVKPQLPREIDAPNFKSLSTFCDTLKYFIVQNAKGYSWLKEGKGIYYSDQTLYYSSKIDLIGFTTTIENDNENYSAEVKVLETFDAQEANRMHETLLEKFIVCLSDYELETVGSEPKDNWVSLSYQFKKTIKKDIIDVIEIDLTKAQSKKDDRPLYFVTIFL